MFPVAFEGSDIVLSKPNETTHDEVECLSVQRVMNGRHMAVLSCWRVTKEELEEISKTGRIWLMVMGETMPPVCLDGVKPQMEH